METVRADNSLDGEGEKRKQEKKERSIGEGHRGRDLSVLNAGGRKQVESKGFHVRETEFLLPCIIGRKRHTEVQLQ